MRIQIAIHRYVSAGLALTLVSALLVLPAAAQQTSSDRESSTKTPATRVPPKSPPPDSPRNAADTSQKNPSDTATNKPAPKAPEPPPKTPGVPPKEPRTPPKAPEPNNPRKTPDPHHPPRTRGPDTAPAQVDLSPDDALPIVSDTQAPEGPASATQSYMGQGSIEVKVLVIKASNQDKNIDPALRDLAQQLRPTFRFSGYQLLRTDTRRTDLGKTVTFDLADSYTLRITPTQIIGDRIAMAVQGPKGLSLMMRLKPGRYQLLGGWPINDGTLLAAVASGSAQ
jgi:hypothetical protein